MCKAWHSHNTIQCVFLVLLGNVGAQSLDNIALIFSSEVALGIYGTTAYYKLNLNTGEQQLLRQWTGGQRLPHAAILDSTGQRMLMVWEQVFGTSLVMSYINIISLEDRSTNGEFFIFGSYVRDDQDTAWDGTLETAKFYRIQSLVAPRDATFLITLELMPLGRTIVRRLDIAQKYVKTLVQTSESYSGIKCVDVAPSGKFIVYSKQQELIMYTFPSNTTEGSVGTGVSKTLSSGAYGYLDGHSEVSEITEPAGLVISPDEEWIFFVHLYSTKFYLRGVRIITQVTYTFFWIDSFGVSVKSLSMGNSPDILWMCTSAFILEFRIRSQGFSLIRTFVNDKSRSMSVWSRQIPGYTGYDTASNYKLLQPCSGSFSVSLVSCLVQSQFVLEPPSQPFVMPTEAKPTTSTMWTTSSTTALQTTSSTFSSTTTASMPSTTGPVRGWSSLPFPRLADFFTYNSFKQTNFLLVYTNSDRSVNVRSGTSSYFMLDLNTTALRFLFSYDTFSLSGTLRAILDSTGCFVYVVVVDNYKSQIFKKSIKEDLPWVAVVNSNALHILPGGGFVDGPLSTARFGYITRVMSPRNASFFLLADCDSRAIRRVDFDQNYVKTLVDGMPFQQFLAVDLSPSGNFFVWEQNNMLLMYVFPLDWAASPVTGETLVILAAGGEGYRDGTVDQAQISNVKSMVVSPDDKWVYFSHNYNTGLYVRGVNLATKVTFTFYSNASTTQEPTFMAMGRSPDVLWLSCVNPGSIWQLRVRGSSMSMMAQYSVNNVMSLSVWTWYLTNLPGYDAFSDYRFVQACPPGKYDSGIMYCEDCPKATFNTDYSATFCETCPSDKDMLITGSSDPFAAENACPTNKTSSATPQTTTLVPLTTTAPSFPQPIKPLRRVSVAVGEYCSNFREVSIDFRGVWDCNSISNTFGCNGTWALIGFNGVVCPWELGQGCSASIYPNLDTASCYINCESGCLNKSKCTNIPQNAFFTGVGENLANNCPWSCDSNYKQVGQTCVRDETVNFPLPPSTTLKRCTSHLDCTHCPAVNFESSNLYRVMGCSGYGVHLYVEGINYGNIDSLTYFLSSAYCVYYLNYSYGEYCPDPVSTTDPLTTTPPPVIPISTDVILAQVTTTALTNPRFTCTLYKNCSYCPMNFTSGCSGVTVVQRFPNGMYGVIMQRYFPPGMMQGKCVFFDKNWKYCPEDNLVFPEPRVVKVVLGFSFTVPEPVIDDAVISKYKKIISTYLNISESFIFLTLASSVSIQRRLLAENVVYGNIEVEPSQASFLIGLMSSPAFKNALLNVSASVIPGSIVTYDFSGDTEMLPVETTSLQVQAWQPYYENKISGTHSEPWDIQSTTPFFIFIGTMWAICTVCCVCNYLNKLNSQENDFYDHEMLRTRNKENEKRVNDAVHKMLWKKIKR